jgi:hypothetical protein
MLAILTFTISYAFATSCEMLKSPYSTFHTNLNKPVLLKGAAKHWNAQSTWTHNYLKGILANVTFPDGSLENILNNPNKYIFSKISKTTGKIITDPPNQSNFTPYKYIDHLNPLFNEWYNHNKINQQAVHHFLIIGGQGSGVSFHNHQNGAWNGLISGRKKWFLYSPTIDTLAIDKNGFPSWWNNNTFQGRIEFQSMSTERLRLNILPIVCSQEKGDVMYVPALWHHMIINEDHYTVGINAIYDNSKNVHLYAEL